MMAESEDGETWKKSGLALDVGGEGSWDFGGVGSPSVIRYISDLIHAIIYVLI